MKNRPEFIEHIVQQTNELKRKRYNLKNFVSVGQQSTSDVVKGAIAHEVKTHPISSAAITGGIIGTGIGLKKVTEKQAALILADEPIKEIYPIQPTRIKTVHDVLNILLKQADIIAGGEKGLSRKEGKKPGEVDPKQLRMGIQVEHEHSDNPKVQKEIAMDHLTEHPKYYIGLAKMENALSREEEKKAFIQQDMNNSPTEVVITTAGNAAAAPFTSKNSKRIVTAPKHPYGTDPAKIAGLFSNILKTKRTIPTLSSVAESQTAFDKAYANKSKQIFNKLKAKGVSDKTARGMDESLK